jgi:hypothetical protein
MCIFGSPKIPEVAPPPPPPTPVDPAIEESKKRLRESEQRRSGRRASILTSPQGDLGETEIARPEARSGAATLG